MLQGPRLAPRLQPLLLRRARDQEVRIRMTKSVSTAEATDVQTITRIRSRQLLWHGVFLFLIGLLTGFVEQRFTNVRMGLSAHLEGLMNGTFLIALGAAWTAVRLPRSAETTAYWILLYGTYGNWLVTSIAAVFGTAANTPIASAGHHGLPWQETFVATGFLSVAIAMVAASVLALWGLRRVALRHREESGITDFEIPTLIKEGR
jgi:(hydroxyamino)benzene mutase